MNQADVDAVWRSVEQPAAVGDLAGKAAPNLAASLEVLLAVDHQGLRHLLIPAQLESKLPRRPQTKGLEVALDELRVGGRASARYYDVASQEKSANSNFTAVATEILEALELDHSDVANTLDAILDRWRWFWGVPPNA